MIFECDINLTLPRVRLILIIHFYASVSLHASKSAVDSRPGVVPNRETDVTTYSNNDGLELPERKTQSQSNQALFALESNIYYQTFNNCYGIIK